MRRGHLSEYFEGVAAKRLSAVEADTLRSNQHEFNGVEGLRALLGEPEGKVAYPSMLLYLSDEEPNPLVEEATLTWYDARQKARQERNVMRWEYRLYFPTTPLTAKLSPGDLLVIAKRRDGGLLVIAAAQGSSASGQLEWLFGFDDLAGPAFTVRDEAAIEQKEVEFASRLILESIGVSVEATLDDALEDMLVRFGGGFPSTTEFSSYARSTLDLDCREDPDAVLLAWMEREERLFRTLERHMISSRIAHGFGRRPDQVDVDGFISFSLSVHNRRKSRVGRALENHLAEIFSTHGISYSRTAVTEGRSKPDFLFPSHHAYHDPAFDPQRLTMLGVKSTCKDRWRQVLAEADRIPQKHLFTLETAISIHQTDEMREKGLQLVLPAQLHNTFKSGQRPRLMSLTAFAGLVRSRQKQD